MPRVPYSPVPSVGAVGGGTPSFSPSNIQGAFGEDVARSLSTLGGTVAKVGDEISSRAIAMQELANQTEAKEAESRYIIRTGELRAQYNSLQGEAAVKGYPQYMEDLRRAREEIRESLSNHAAQRLYDGPSQNTMAYTIYQGAGHSATQQKAWASGAAVARVEINGIRALNEPEDELAFRRSLVDSVENVKSLSDIKGWSPEQTEKVATETTSDLWSKRISGLARKKPFEAKQLLDEAVARRDIQGTDIERAEKVVQQNMYTTGARMISIEIAGQDPDREMSLEERLKLAEEKAEKIAPGDGLFKDYVRQRVDTDWNHRTKVEKDNEFNNKQTVAGAILYGVDGKMPVTVDELLADPKVAAAWNDLPETTQKSFMANLRQNAKGDVPWTNERLLKDQALKGLAATDPNSFLEQDLTGVDIPLSAKRKLMDLQTKMKSSPGADPRIGKALTTMRPDLAAAGILGTPDYPQFAGALWDQLNDFEDANKRPPKGPEILEIGRRLLSEQANSQSWWGTIGLQGKERMFRMPVPDKDREEIEGLILEKRGRVATEDEIQRYFVREQYHKLFGKAAPKVADPNAPQPPVPK